MNTINFMRASVGAVLIWILLTVNAFATTFSDVVINSVQIKHPVWHKMIMPSEDLHIDLPAGSSAYINGQPVEDVWRSPAKAGNHNLIITSGEMTVAKITIFVLEPSTKIDERGFLGKYRIGKYPRNTPHGFIKLQKGEGRLAISPSFNVGQFLCKQQPRVWPKYLLVSEDNLHRLEVLLKDLNDKNITDANTFFIMSGYRTPFYNTAIGSAKFSRHMYGDAADIYIDTKPRDGVMDDINRDGKINKKDANYLYDHAQKLFITAESVQSGGLGSYRANAVHGPFVHSDSRGNIARWGR